jgi:hypothetical protein
MAKKEKPIAEMGDDELMAAWDATGEEATKLKERLKEFSQEHQKRERLKQLNLSASDLELLQSVTPEGIESLEAVNTDG